MDPLYARYVNEETENKEDLEDDLSPGFFTAQHFFALSEGFKTCLEFF